MGKTQLQSSLDGLHSKLDKVVLIVAGGQDTNGKVVRGHDQRIEELEYGQKTAKRAAWTAGFAVFGLAAKSVWDLIFRGAAH